MNSLVIPIDYRQVFKRCILIDFIIAIAFLADSFPVSILGIGVLLLMLFVSNSEDHIYYYISLMPLLASIRLGNINVLFLFFSVSILKYFCDHFRFKTNTLCFIGFVYILSIELLFDLINWNIGQFLNLFTVIFYVLLLLISYPWRKTSYSFVLNLLIYVGVFCLSLTAISTAISGESLASYVQATEGYMRFGENEVSHSLGGAMGIPVYAMVTIACCFVTLITSDSGLRSTAIYISIIICCVFFGVLTHSRNFLIGFFGFVITSVLASFIRKNNTRGIVITIVLGLVAVSFLIFNTEWLNNILKLFKLRGEWLEDIRLQVWKDCFSFWGDNIPALLFGLGSKNYTFVGSEESYLFYMCAHNIILDGIMSWGIIGFGLFLIMLYDFYLKIHDHYNIRDSIIYSVPLFVWLIMKMTSGSFQDSYEYFFIISLIIIAAHHEPANNQRVESRMDNHGQKAKVDS